jgi:predicted nucleic acid-binding protein
VITAVDSNVLLDIFGDDPLFQPRSTNMLRSCSLEGRLIACEVVWAEVAGYFPSPQAVQEAMTQIGVEFSPTSLPSSLSAGEAWKVYCRRGGRRRRMVADFLIGAHSLLQADRLLTRDRGFYRAYFSRLPILDPAKEGR